MPGRKPCNSFTHTPRHPQSSLHTDTHLRPTPIGAAKVPNRWNLQPRRPVVVCGVLPDIIAPPRWELHVRTVCDCEEYDNASDCQTLWRECQLLETCRTWRQDVCLGHLDR